MDEGNSVFLWVVVAGLGAWFAFGDPKKTVANNIWPEDAAPWETVDAFFYPDNSDLSKVETEYGLADVESCHGWVRDIAVVYNDPGLQRSDWECGLGTATDWNGLRVYRATVQ